MKKVIICDDEKAMRDFYETAVKTIANVNVITIEHPELLDNALKKHPDTDVLIMDIRFPKTLGDTIMEEIGHTYLPYVRKNYPHIKIVVATTLGSDVYNIVIDCMRKQLQDDWIDVGKNNLKGEEVRARIEPLLYPFGSISESGVWLLHLSDLHFGNSARFDYWGFAEDGALYNAIQKDFNGAISTDYEINFKGVDFIISTGDITDKARDEEYGKAKDFLCQCSKMCLNVNKATSDLDRIRRVLIIPGNHDINYDISRARSFNEKSKTVKGKRIKYYDYNSKIKEDTVPEELEYLKKYTLAPFSEFLASLHQDRPAFDEMWNLNNSYKCALWSYPEMGLVFIGLNTAGTAISHLENDPKITPEVLSKLQGFIDKQTMPKKLFGNIALMHHSLGSKGSGTERVNNAEIGTLREEVNEKLKATVFLTGHVHKATCEIIQVDNKALLFIGGGSASASPSEIPPQVQLQYNIIHIKPEDTSKNRGATITVYPRILLEGKFTKHPSKSKFLYKWNKTAGWVIQEG